jgi:hypothetical protein
MRYGEEEEREEHKSTSVVEEVKVGIENVTAGRVRRRTPNDLRRKKRKQSTFLSPYFLLLLLFLLITSPGGSVVELSVLFTATVTNTLFSPVTRSVISASKGK